MKNKAYLDVQILSNVKITDSIFEMKVKCQDTPFPGQFYMLRAWGISSPYLSRPISICDSDIDTLTFLYMTTGKGTKILSKLLPGQKVSLLGPLGNGFDIKMLCKKQNQKIAIVAGGIGLAPFLYLAKELTKSGTHLDFYTGFSSEPYYLDQMSPYFDKICVYTLSKEVFAQHSGESSEKLSYSLGFPTDNFQDEVYDYILSCGPTAMMNSLRNKVENPEKLYLSLENHMGCGIGVCLSCSAKTKDGMKSVCTSGPVFCAADLVKV